MLPYRGGGWDFRLKLLIPEVTWPRTWSREEDGRTEAEGDPSLPGALWWSRVTCWLGVLFYTQGNGSPHTKQHPGAR